MTPHEPDLASPALRRLLGGLHLILALLLGYLLLALWPSLKSDANGNLLDAHVSVFSLDFTINPEVQFLLVVIIAAGVGSFAYMASSFVAYAGNKQLDKNFFWWYVLRPFIGAALALVLYFLTRGGLLSAKSNVNELNPYGIAGVAALTGMFSREATEKLREVFRTLFATKEATPLAAPLKDGSASPSGGTEGTGSSASESSDDRGTSDNPSSGGTQ